MSVRSGICQADCAPGRLASADQGRPSMGCHPAVSPRVAMSKENTLPPPPPGWSSVRLIGTLFR